MERDFRPTLVWLEANACSGDSISTFNATQPGLGQVLGRIFRLTFWNALSPDEGATAVRELAEALRRGGYYLVVEGAVPTAGGGKFAFPFKLGDRFYTAAALVRWLAARAAWVVAAGTCAAFGGPSAARPNPSNSKGVWEVVPQPVINVSGCPVNPDWLVGTLIHLLRFGAPELDRYRRPVLYYGNTVHAHCQRRSYFERGEFARNLGDPECMLLLGCMGPVTGADCPYRLWNDHLNWPVKASTPCIGCTKAGFPDKSTPFHAPFPAKYPPSGRRREVER